jgi:hypothetical protein
VFDYFAHAVHNAQMPNIKPLKQFVKKTRDLRDRHGERHRPSGFGFALADSVDYLDAARWDALTAHDSLFLSRRYLRVLEEAGPKNVRQGYALIFRGREAVAAVAAQAVTVSLARARRTTRHEKLTAPLERLEGKMFVCGNLLSWGMHGVVFAPNEDNSALWPAVAEALYRLRRADKLFGDTDLVMVKDIPESHAGGASALARFSYRQLETEPNMVLEISPGWRTYDDYLASLTSKYRKTSKQIDKDVLAAGRQLELLTNSDVARHASILDKLVFLRPKGGTANLLWRGV